MLATDEPIPGVRLVGTVQRKAAEKKALGTGRERKETLLSPNSFLSLFSPPLYFAPLSTV